jgi:hypothetical protein
MTVMSAASSPELEIEPAQHRGHGCDKRIGYDHADQQHHPRLTVSRLPNGALKNGVRRR